jgi:hypothetical protein
MWPSCWSNDDILYAANGDGKGFNLNRFTYSDIAINRISGSLFNLRGGVTAEGDAVGQVWTQGGRYNRKPTGMVYVDGAIYVAIQDLNINYDDAPAASFFNHGQPMARTCKPHLTPVHCVRFPSPNDLRCSLWSSEWGLRGEVNPLVRHPAVALPSGM